MNPDQLIHNINHTYGANFLASYDDPDNCTESFCCLVPGGFLSQGMVDSIASNVDEYHIFVGDTGSLFVWVFQNIYSVHDMIFDWNPARYLDA